MDNYLTYTVNGAIVKVGVTENGLALLETGGSNYGAPIAAETYKGDNAVLYELEPEPFVSAPTFYRVQIFDETWTKSGDFTSDNITPQAALETLLK